MAMVKAVSRREKHWVLLFGILIATLTTLPYVLGFISQGDEWVYSGFVYGVEDGNSYIAKMLQGSSGSWLFRSPYSTLPQTGVLAFLPFMLLGKLAGGEELHLQLVLLFHLFRIGATFFTLSATYRFVSLFVKQANWRRWSTVLATIGGGLGWFLVLIGQSFWLDSLPLEWHSTEWFGFLGYYGLPHMLLARGLLLTGLTFYLSAPEANVRAWYAGLVFLALSLVHPLALVSTVAIIGAHQVSVWLLSWRRKSWGPSRTWFQIAFRVLIMPAPVVLYTTIRFSTDPFLQAWTDQNLILTPHPLHILIAYGLMLIPAGIGVRPLLRSRRWTGMMILSWILILPILAYAPHNLQRRFPEGIWVAIVTLAAIGMRELSQRFGKRGRRFGTATLILSLPSALMLIFGGLQVAGDPSLPIFRPADEVKVFEWLEQHSDPGVVVLSTYQTGNALPAWVPGFVVVGHGPESANLVEFRVMVKAYYSGRLTKQAQLEFVQTQGIDYVFYGPEEQAEGHLDIDAVSYLKPAFRSGEYRIFEVLTPTSAPQ